MKKHILLLLPCLLWCFELFAQTEQLNHQKYWNYREKFKKYFVVSPGRFALLRNPCQVMSKQTAKVIELSFAIKTEIWQKYYLHWRRSEFIIFITTL